ncbi:MAG TPA: nitrilase-related carbon-nitrogen hydrolase, partial [Ignavibacteriaceae bacterium]|nr:nitrilase-related carbon-nitrogen hydrolase [Ignavibacteriaceae bacterium]
MKIALVQYSPVWENKSVSMEKLKSLLAQTDAIDLLIFPEMTLTGFTMKSNDFAEELEGESYIFFSSLAKEKKCAVMYGMIEKGKKKNFNTLVHLNNQGKIISTYRKIHPFSYSTEDVFYGKGKNTVVTKVKGIKIGLSICYDLRFPELYRFYAKEKVHLIVDIANWPDTRIEHWRTLLKARAIENQCYVAGVNRVGNDPKLHYNGFSSVFDPMGKEIVAVEN